MTTRPDLLKDGDGARTNFLPHKYPISLFLSIFPRWPWIGDSSPTTPMACLESEVPVVRPTTTTTTSFQSSSRLLSGVLCFLSLSLLSDSFSPLFFLHCRHDYRHGSVSHIKPSPSFGPAILPLSLYIFSVTTVLRSQSASSPLSCIRIPHHITQRRTSVF